MDVTETLEKLNINDTFVIKADLIRNSPIDDTKEIDNNTKLNFYKYYKQATLGDCNSTCPSIFELSKRAQWNAWNNIKGTVKEDAMKMYIYYADIYIN